MGYIWQEKNKSQWHFWDRFEELLELVASHDGKVVNEQWLNDEMAVIGELGLAPEFIKMYESGLKVSNPNNSSLAYFLGATDEEPLSYPRGMAVSQARNSFPDIDLDMQDTMRDAVIDYTRNKYGVDRTAQIVTFGEIGAKKAVRDVCRVLGKPYELGDRLSKAMPPAVFGVSADLEHCMKNAEFLAIYDSDPEAREVVDTAFGIEGLWRNTGTHAAGVLIADAPITNYVPVMQAGEMNPIMTQYNMSWTEICGLLKIDFLGLANLSIVSKCLDNLRETQGIDIPDAYRLLDELDPAVFEALSMGNNIGVFQMESKGFRELMMAMKPTTLNDISAMLALYRPGPMGSNVHKEYAARKNGLKPTTYLHPVLKPILKDTYGLLLYQEQLLEITKTVAGKDAFESDEFRSIVGKKKIDKMPAQRASFVNGCVEVGGMRRPDAEQLFSEIEHHASYSFNKSHSFSYGFLSYITAYLKVNYPIEYMAAILSAAGDDEDNLRMYLNECRDIGITVKRPSLSFSDHDFSIKDNEILYGLDGIKGFGGPTSAEIIENRSEDPYRNIFDLMRRGSAGVLNRKVLLTLIKAGGLDELLTLPDYEEPLSHHDKIELLFHEGLQLGVFLGDHPFTELQYLTYGKVSHTIDQAYDSPIGTFVSVAGVVTSVEKKTTRSGSRMFILNIEDNERSIEVIAFATFAETLGESPFRKSDLVVVSGKLRGNNSATSSEGVPELNIIMSGVEVINYDEIGNMSPPIYLRSEKELDSFRLEKMVGIINHANGSSPVFLEMTTESGKTMVIKFEKTTSLESRGVLQQLIEV